MPINLFHLIIFSKQVSHPRLGPPLARAFTHLPPNRYPRCAMPKLAYYAVAAGRKPGIYHTWPEAEAQVKGFAGAKYKKFPTQVAAQAFIGSGKQPYDSATLSRSSKSLRSTSTIASSSTSSAKSDPRDANTGRNRAESPPSSAPPEVLPPHLVLLAEKGYTFSRTAPHRLVVYTDGSGLGNGKRGAVAGAGVFWGPRGEAGSNNLAERVPGLLQTNNRGELLSIIRAVETCPYPDMPLEVRTDSQYSINCMTVFLHKWIQNGWKTGGAKGESVKNADMIRHLLVLLRQRKSGASVNFKYVRGHAGHEGNEAADKLARAGALNPPLPDRTDWLDPDTSETTAAPKNNVVSDLEVDPNWLMDEEELTELQSSLAEK